MYLLRSRPPLDNPFLMECFFAVGRFSQESAAFCTEFGGWRWGVVLEWGQRPQMGFETASGAAGGRAGSREDATHVGPHFPEGSEASRTLAWCP